jgi:hypothetical protein
MTTLDMTRVGTLALGLLVCGCDDSSDERDAAVRDAAVRDAAPDSSAALDATTGQDAGTDDAGTDDAGSDAQADAGGALTLTIALSTEAEVPVCATAGAEAEGSATVTIDAADTSVAVTDLTFVNLSGAATGAHIHFGAEGVAGPVVLDFGTDLTPPIDRTFTSDDYTPPTGAPATFDALVAAIRAGTTYINVHTAACAPGEIRGQIE